MEVIKVILGSIFSALILFIIAKVIGHKQVAQLDFFDYITGITIGSIGAEMATTLDSPWWKPAISMVVYGAITFYLSFFSRKFPRSRKYINGAPTIIMDNGKLYRENLKKAKLELSEFMVMCRKAGYFNLDDIQTAVFEYNGQLTVLPVSSKRPVNPEDIGLSPKNEYISTEIIMDGRVMGENLKRLGLDTTWLQRELDKLGFKSIREVFLAVCDSDNKLTVY